MTDRLPVIAVNVATNWSALRANVVHAGSRFLLDCSGALTVMRHKVSRTARRTIMAGRVGLENDGARNGAYAEP
jgi:hypothetical protein